MPEHFNIPFQYWLYLIMTVINVALGLSGSIGNTIKLVTNLFVEEAAELIVGSNGFSPNDKRDALQNASDRIKSELEIRKPFGRVVGVIERQLYLYAMFTGINDLFAGVLLFKAFFTWTERAGLTDEITQKDDTKASRILVLTRYYGYAIGNFLSLIWAFVIFEVVKGLVQSNNCLIQLIIIDTAAY